MSVWLPPPRVLVVDDEEGPREAIRMILKRRCEVWTVASGEEALAALPGCRADVVVMDVRMPGMDGVHLLERVKAGHPRVEVVMITAYASLDTVQRAMRLGALDYLVKPFEQRELLEAVERALARQRQEPAAPGPLAGLIRQMRDLVRGPEPSPAGGGLSDLLPAMLREARRGAGAMGASFFGIEPPAMAHLDVPETSARWLESAWPPPLVKIRKATFVARAAPAGAPWPPGLPTTVDGALIVPVTDDGVPRVAGHIVLWMPPPASVPVDIRSLPPVVDLMVTALRTAALLEGASRQAREQALRAVQGEILRRISTAVLEDPSVERTLSAITAELSRGGGYEQVQVRLGTDALEPGGPGRAVFPLVAQGRPLGQLVVETDGSGRDLDRSERDLLGMFAELLALIVRNAGLHRELSDAKMFLESLVQSAAEGIVAVDPDSRVVTWNAAAERMFGRPADGVLGRPLAEALPSTVVAQLEPAMTSPEAARVWRVRTEEPARPDGARREVALTCSPIPWGGRPGGGRLLIARDVTELSRWEEQIARSEKLSALGQLAAGMAHEFSNLLHVILGHTELLVHDPSPRQIATGLGTIEQAVRDGVETVGRIKRLARREVDRRLERVDLRELAGQVIEIVRPRWAHAGRRTGSPIVVGQDFAAVPPVRARAAEIREALINLVLNAVDALPAGGAITLHTRPEGDWVVVAVADTGPGIPPEVRPHIFEPFFTTKDTGTGLGLPIVSGIVSSHGGAIDVESSPGAGTRFTIRLPAAPAED